MKAKEAEISALRQELAKNAQALESAIRYNEAAVQALRSAAQREEDLQTALAKATNVE